MTDSTAEDEATDDAPVEATDDAPVEATDDAPVEATDEATDEAPDGRLDPVVVLDDATSFAAFYAAEAESVHRALRATVVSPTVAREAVDEAMARAYERWSVVRTYDAPAGWVYRTALNWSISWWRKHRRERALPDAGDEDRTVGEIDPEGALALDALRRLPLDQRAVVVCRVLLDLDVAATALALDIAEGTVKSRLSRGLDALRTDLEVQP